MAVDWSNLQAGKITPEVASCTLKKSTKTIRNLLTKTARAGEGRGPGFKNVFLRYIMYPEPSMLQLNGCGVTRVFVQKELPGPLSRKKTVHVLRNLHPIPDSTSRFIEHFNIPRSSAGLFGTPEMLPDNTGIFFCGTFTEPPKNGVHHNLHGMCLPAPLQTHRGEWIFCDVSAWCVIFWNSNVRQTFIPGICQQDANMKVFLFWTHYENFLFFAMLNKEYGEEEYETVSSMHYRSPGNPRADKDNLYPAVHGVVPGLLRPGRSWTER